MEGKSYFQERVLENESCSTEHCRVASLEPRTQLPRTGWVQSHPEPWGSAKAGNTSSFKLRGEEYIWGAENPPIYPRVDQGLLPDSYHCAWVPSLEPGMEERGQTQGTGQVCCLGRLYPSLGCCLPHLGYVSILLSMVSTLENVMKTRLGSAHAGGFHYKADH